MEFSTRHRTRDNQRCTGIVNEYGIHLIDNGVVMRTLYKLIRRMCHIVTEVVKTKFVIGTIGDISSISHAATRRVRLIVIYTFHLQAMELEKRSHPSTVSASQVVVHSNQMYSIASEGVKVKRQGSHQSFTFPCLHLCNFSLVQSNPSNELYIIMYHIPSDRLSSSIPRVFPKGFVSLYAYIIFHRSKFSIIRRSGYLKSRIIHKALGSFFYYCKGFRKNFVKHLFTSLVSLIG